MDIDTLLRVARETIDAVTYCFAITISADGEANARLIQPRKLHDDWTVDFLTRRTCRKFREIAASGKLTLAYEHDADRTYVSLIGHAKTIDDVELRRARWSPAADRWNPQGPDDPNLTYVRLTPYRIELWSSGRDIMPEPKGYSAAVLTRTVIP